MENLKKPSQKSTVVKEPISNATKKQNKKKGKSNKDKQKAKPVIGLSTNAKPTNHALASSVSTSIIDNEKPTDEEIRKRRMRFAKTSPSSTNKPHIKPTGPIVGTCTKLEKAYFRLTTEPILEDIRPEPVLHEALKRLKKIWKEKQDCNYLLDQLKAIRQDLVVQGISNAFTVKVYEYNAKIALYASNLNEFNQCQSMLSVLYKTIDSKHKIQFLAYQIVYDLIMNNSIDLHHHIQQVQTYLTEPAIHFALLVPS